MLGLGHTLATAAGLRPRKKFHFDVSFSLMDIINCTYISGVLFAKVRLKDGGSFIEVSRRVDLQSHSVKWQQIFKFPCKMYASANTAELEPCICKVSIRKETKGGRSYKKLGFVKINLAEYAGAGEVQRKYLLESYNEHKHKPDNSILKVKISLRQTSGDVLFKAPRAPVWEISVAEDEGIQADVQSTRSRTSYSNARTSTASTISGLSTGSGSGSLLLQGGSLQDMRARGSISKESGKRKSISACSLRGQSSSSEYNSAPSSAASIEEEDKEQLEKEIDKDVALLQEEARASKSPESVSCETTEVVPEVTPRSITPNIGSTQTDLLTASLQNRSNSVGSSDFSCLALLSASRGHSHRRQASLGVLSTTLSGSTGSPVRIHHKRYQSLSMIKKSTSPKSTSPNSTLTEKTVGSLAQDSHETISICSQRSRLSLFPSTKMEQSRQDAKSIVDKLFQSHDLTHTEEDESSSGLKIYIDKSRGTAHVTGQHLDSKKYGNLIELSNHSTSEHRTDDASTPSSDKTTRSSVVRNPS